MTQSAPGATAPVLIHPQAQTLTHHSIAQYRAIQFVSDRIAEADASRWHGGYIHGLIQALTMTSTITVEQACMLEQAQEQASCKTFNRRAVGGAA